VDRLNRGATSNEQLLLTADEAAEIVGIGRTRIYDLMRCGAIESVRIGRSRRIPCDALTAYVERLRAEASGYEVVYRAP
jgi:excisionase family DNA binding protein